jgi:hypothetical protein
MRLMRLPVMPPAAIAAASLRARKRARAAVNCNTEHHLS